MANSPRASFGHDPDASWSATWMAMARDIVYVDDGTVTLGEPGRQPLERPHRDRGTPASPTPTRSGDRLARHRRIGVLWTADATGRPAEHVLP
jgi:hypothetical protein